MNVYSSSVAAHEKHAKGFFNLELYTRDNYNIQNDWYLPSGFEQFVYTTQVMQAFAVEQAIKAHLKGKPYCMGTLYWQINDAWPSLSWASRDYHGHWKALHYKAKHLYA